MGSCKTNQELKLPVIVRTKKLNHYGTLIEPLEYKTRGLQLAALYTKPKTFLIWSSAKTKSLKLLFLIPVFQQFTTLANKILGTQHRTQISLLLYLKESIARINHWIRS